MHKGLVDRFEDISNKIQAACQQAQRSEEEIKLVAVSKLQPVSVIEKSLCAWNK